MKFLNLSSKKKDRSLPPTKPNSSLLQLNTCSFLPSQANGRTALLALHSQVPCLAPGERGGRRGAGASRPPQRGLCIWGKREPLAMFSIPPYPHMPTLSPDNVLASEAFCQIVTFPSHRAKAWAEDNYTRASPEESGVTSLAQAT